MTKGSLVIAGVSFPCGASEIGSVAFDHGFQPIYLEHAKYITSVEESLKDVKCSEQIPDQLIRQEGLFLPILESWVSEGAKLKANAALRFDVSAANVSRSKIALSSSLERAGLDFVPRRLVANEPAAIEAASELGYPVVFRNDSGYSGRGVWVLGSPMELSYTWGLSQRLSDRDDFREMNSVLGKVDSGYVIEPYFESEEWSVDFVVSPEFVLLIRATEKATVLAEGSPLCVGYRLVDCADIHAELREAVSRWAKALFDSRSVSFGCFDIRRNRHGKLVALDFGARLGGDQVPLLLRAASNGRNPYAAALDAALTRDPSKLQTLRHGAAIIHVFSKPNTVFNGLSPTPKLRVLNSRKPGYVADKTSRNRVATVMSHFDSSAEFFEASKTTDRWLLRNGR